MPLKMVIVMRTDLNMRKGKMCAQAAHAAVMSVLHTENYETHEQQMDRSFWLTEGQRKIVVGVNSLEELEVIKVKAWQAGIPLQVVTDRGDTEFHGKPTVTCMALGPATDEELDPITGDLKLL